MHRYSRSIWLLLLLTAPTLSASGQWKIVSPHAVLPQYDGAAALNFCDGILHVSGGGYQMGVSAVLLNSSDTGKTWYSLNFPDYGISDINFYDRNIGVVCCRNGSIYVTHDGGSTWKEVFSGGTSFQRVSFDGSPLIIHALFGEADAMIISTDGGVTWTTARFGVYAGGLGFTVAKGGIVYAFSSEDYNSPNNGWVNMSTDSGKTWSAPKGRVDGDSYTISVDSCNEQMLYLVNEDTILPSDANTHIFISSDAGQTWMQTFVHSEPYLAGSLANSRNVVLVPTIWDGVLRSTDKGLTWVNTGGPGNAVDSRSICTINDNIAFVLEDSTGNIWATYNSGGFPFKDTGAISAAPIKLFTSDTVVCDSLSESVAITKNLCTAPDIYYVSIAGKDSDCFQVSQITDDSIIVTMFGRKQGSLDAELVISLDDGSADSVKLAGVVNIPSKRLSLSTNKLFATDTISCDSVTRSVTFSGNGCPALAISTYNVIGFDSANYRVHNLSSDSVSVTLYGLQQGDQHAQLILSLNNGLYDTIVLSGNVNIIPTNLTFSTQSVQTDTLGGTVSVPITISGLEKTENVTMVLHYDGTVQYLGSFSPAGVRLDIPGDSSNGRSVLSIKGAVSGSIAGYAKFNVFNDSSTAAHATFDSMTVLTQTSPCEYSLPPPVTSTITTLSGCEIPILSQWIHLGIEPILSIVPNPSNGTAYLSSNIDLGDATIEIYDMLGTKAEEFTAAIEKESPLELLLPAPNGVYTVEIRTSAGVEILRAGKVK